MDDNIVVCECVLIYYVFFRRLQRRLRRRKDVLELYLRKKKEPCSICLVEFVFSFYL